MAPSITSEQIPRNNEVESGCSKIDFDPFLDRFFPLGTSEAVTEKGFCVPFAFDEAPVQELCQPSRGQQLTTDCENERSPPRAPCSEPLLTLL